MQPIQINVSVSVGVTQELYGLLLPLLNRLQTEAPAAAPAPRKPRTAKQQPVVAEEKPEEVTAPAETDVPEPQPQPEPEQTTAAPAPVASEPENKVYTEEDVRAAMDRTRKRIEGENYKERTDSPEYQKWHRTLTGWFKNTSTMLGYEKPSYISDSETRGKFIARCDKVYVKDDELIEDCPF